MPDDLTHPHDLLCRSILRETDLAADFFANHLDSGIVRQLDLSQLECLTPIDIDKKLAEKIADLRFKTVCKELSKTNKRRRLLNVFLFFEHQSSRERFMSVRILETISRGHRQYLNDNKSVKTVPYPIAVILYNGKRPWKFLTVSDVTDIPDGFGTNILQYTVVFVDVSNLTEEEIGRGHPINQALIWTLRYGINKELLDKNYIKIFDLLGEAKDDKRVKDWLSAFFTYISSRSDMPGYQEVIEKTYTKITNDPKEAKKMTQTLATRLMARGEVRGEARGELRGEAKSIIIALTTRFGGKIPKTISRSIESYTDAIALDSLLQSALTCGSLEEFKKELK